MNRQNIEQIIKDLFKDDYRADPERFSGEDAQETANTDAGLYWYYRTEEEEQRDEKAGVTLGDYQKWVLEVLTELKKESV